MSDDGEHMAYSTAPSFPRPRNIIVHYDAEANSRPRCSASTAPIDRLHGPGPRPLGQRPLHHLSVHSPAMLMARPSRRSWRSTGACGSHHVASGGSYGFGDGNSSWPKVSDDGHVLSRPGPQSHRQFRESQTAALVVRDLQGSDLKVASRRPNGTPCAHSGIRLPRISSDGTAVAFVADEFDMSGGTRRAPGLRRAAPMIRRDRIEIPALCILGLCLGRSARPRSPADGHGRHDEMGRRRSDPLSHRRRVPGQAHHRERWRRACRRERPRGHRFHLEALGDEARRRRHVPEHQDHGDEPRRLRTASVFRPCSRASTSTTKC